VAHCVTPEPHPAGRKFDHPEAPRGHCVTPEPHPAGHYLDNPEAPPGALAPPDRSWARGFVVPGTPVQHGPGREVPDQRLFIFFQELGRFMVSSPAGHGPDQAGPAAVPFSLWG